jgi:ABC-type uncharacterized transport system
MSTTPEGTPAPDPGALVPQHAPVPPMPEPAPSYTPPPPATLEQLQPIARALVIGLAWGALMLVLLGFWMRSKNEPSLQVMVTVFLVAGGASAGLAVWQAFTLWFKQETREQKTASLDSQRRFLGNILLVAGLALIGAAFYLGVSKTGFARDNLAESIGVLLFGVLTLASGYSLTLPLNESDESSMRSLAGRTPMLKLIQLVIGAGAIIGFIAIVYTHRVGNAYVNWLPELAALMFLSLLSIACFIWLNAGEFEEVGIRIFVLVFGGAVGCILFFYALARAYLWRDVVLGGIGAWQGPNAWRLWLVVYLQIFALILMFVSFRLARADIRSSYSLRLVMYGYDTLLQALLLFQILAVANLVIASVFLASYDWTKSGGLHGLADSSRNLVTGLKKEINVLVIMRQGNPIYKDLHNLLDNCQSLNGSKFKVTYLPPESSLPQIEQYLKIFPKLVPESGGISQGVLLINGPIPTDEKHNVAYTFVPDRKLHEIDRPRAREDKAAVIFKGEGEILKEVRFLVLDQKKQKIYFLQGDDEPSINNKDDRERADMRDGFANVGINSLVERLQADNFDVVGLRFGKDIGLKPQPNIVFAPDDADKKKKIIPTDCTTLIVAGPSRKLSDEVLAAIEAYMDGNGKLLAFFDVEVEPDYSKMKTSGLETLLKRYGVDVTTDFALRFPRHPLLDPATIVAAYPSRQTENPLAKNFRRPIEMRKSARVVKPLEGGGRFRGEAIFNLELRENEELLYAVEKKTSVLSNPQKFMVDLTKDRAKFNAALSLEPIPVAVAVSEQGGKDGKPRLVVFGDTEFITNRDLERGSDNYAVVVGAIEWMAERDEMIGVQPKISRAFVLPPDTNTLRMIFLPGWIMMLTFISLGIGVWIVRRR